MSLQGEVSAASLCKLQKLARVKSSGVVFFAAGSVDSAVPSTSSESQNESNQFVRPAAQPLPEQPPAMSLKLQDRSNSGPKEDLILAYRKVSF